jgi:hypothetical protein
MWVARAALAEAGEYRHDRNPAGRRWLPDGPMGKGVGGTEASPAETRLLRAVPARNPREPRSRPALNGLPGREVRSDLDRPGRALVPTVLAVALSTIEVAQRRFMARTEACDDNLYRQLLKTDARIHAYNGLYI